MATVAGRQPGVTGTAGQPGGADAQAVAGAIEASGEVNRFGERAGRVMPPVIEVSDKDYRSFCFPCHALEEDGDRNGAV